MKMSNEGGAALCVCTPKIPSGINSEKPLLQQKTNIESWRGPESMHILKTDVHNRILRDRFCFVLCKSGSTTATSTSLLCEKPINRSVKILRLYQADSELKKNKNIKYSRHSNDAIHFSFSSFLTLEKVISDMHKKKKKNTLNLTNDEMMLACNRRYVRAES